MKESLRTLLLGGMVATATARSTGRMRLALLGALLASAPLAGAQGSNAAPLRVTLHTHFDYPWSVDPGELDLLRQLSADYPHIRWTHMWHAAAYTQSTPWLAQIESYLHEDRDLRGGEVGVHTHMWKSLVEAAGVTFHSSPSVSCGSDGSGYKVPTSSYAYSEIRSILEFSIAKFLERGFCRPRSYCAGYYTTNVDLMTALSDTAFVVDAGACPPGSTYGSGFGGCWDAVAGWDSTVTHFTLPYPVSTTSILPGGPAPYLESDLGTLIEIPQVGKIDWMLSSSEMKQLFLAHYQIAESGTPTALSFSLHPSLLGGEYAKFDTVLAFMEAHAAGGAVPVEYVTTSKLREVLGYGATGSGAFLQADVHSISLLSGGSQGLSLDTCPPAPGVYYAVVGSASGTQPGLDLGGVTLPLNPDPYFDLTVNTLGPPLKPPVLQAFGQLDPAGTAAPELALPAGLASSLVGLELTHAALILDVATAIVTEATNPVGVTLAP